MSTIANLVVAVVALLHLYFLILEMFLWDKPAGLRAFGMTKEVATASKVLAVLVHLAGAPEEDNQC